MFLLLQRGRAASRVTAGLAGVLLMTTGLSPAAYAAETIAPAATTPVQHVIVIVGENRSFDHLFATYVPRPGHTVWNLLSKGIITAQGTPGPNFGLAKQYRGVLKAPANFSLTPSAKVPYNLLPPPNTNYAATKPNDTYGAPFATLQAATAMEGQSLEPVDLPLLLSGATGLPQNAIDRRVLNFNQLPNGPFPLSPRVSYDAYTGDAVHRFYQMWQQFDCSVAHATPANPSGCLADLLTWVATSVGIGSNGQPQPADFNAETTREGGNAMGFFNVQLGDMSYFTELARKYTISDNYH